MRSILARRIMLAGTFTFVAIGCGHDNTLLPTSSELGVDSLSSATPALIDSMATLVNGGTSAPAPARTVSVALNDSSLTPNTTAQATATIIDSLGVVLTGRPIAWSSSSPAIAKVNASTGLVTALAAGTSTIIATNGTFIGNVTITVAPVVVPVAAVKSITAALSNSSIVTGATSQATATLKDSLGQVVAGQSVTWTSAYPAIASVNATTGVVTGVAVGTSSISASNGSVVGSIGITITAPPVQGSMGARLATGPTSFVNSAYVSPLASAHVYRVAAGQNLQARIDSAKPGDVILLAAGATFTGPFTLRAKTGGTSPIIIRSDAPDAQLPAEGTRMTPAFAAKLPKLVAATAASMVVSTAPRAANYRLMFLEVAPVAGNDINTLVRIGSANSDQRVLDSIPSNIILDRVYLHGLATKNLVRCVQVHGKGIAIVDSYLSEAHANGQDSQAIVGWNGPGPYKIVNNMLSAAGENVMFGGGTPQIPGMISSDIEMRGNYIWKDLAWKGSIWSVKNHLEFKAGQRVLVEGNIFENNWIAAQSGVSILIKSSYQSGWNGAVSRDIILRSNRVKNVVSAISIAAQPDGPAISANLILVVNNIFEQISPASTGGIGIRLNADVKNIVFQNNTLAFAPGGGNTTVQFDRGSRPVSDSVAFINNVLGKAANYGVLGLDGGGGEGTNSLVTYHASFTGNVMNGVTAGQYPTTGGNSYPLLLTLVYPAWQLSNWTIATLFQNLGTNGKDPGADIASVTAATAKAR